MKPLSLLFAIALVLSGLPTTGIAECGSQEEHQGRIVATSKLLHRQLFGFFEYLDPGSTVAPKKYKKKTLTGAYDQSGILFYINTVTMMPDYNSPIGSFSDTQVYTGSWDFIAPYTRGGETHQSSVLTTTSTQGGEVISYDPSWEWLYDSWYTFAVSHGVAGTSITPTRIAVQGTYVGEHGFSWNADIQETLSDEFTVEEANAIAEAEANQHASGNARVSFAYPFERNWQEPKYHGNNGGDLRQLPVKSDAQRVRFHAEFSNLCPSTWHIECKLKRWAIGTAESTAEPYTPGALPGGGTLSGDIEVAQSEATTTFPLAGEIELPLEEGWNIGVTAAVATDIGSTCPLGVAGDSKSKNSSVNFSVSLGRTARGGLAGNVVLHADRVSSSLYSPTVLERSSYFSADASLVRDGLGQLVQLLAPQCLVDIVVINDSSYELRIYQASQVGNLDAVTHRRVLSGDPYVTYRVANPNIGQDSESLQVEELRGGMTKTTTFANDIAGSVSLTLDGVSFEKVSHLSNGNTTDEIRRIVDAAGVLFGQTTNITRSYPFGEVLVERRITIDTAEDYQAAFTSYYENQATDGGAYGQIKERLDPDGSWTRYTYDTQGRVTNVLRPFLDAEPTWDGSQCRSTETIYGSITDADGDSQPEKLTTTLTRISGTETGCSYRVQWTAPLVFGGAACLKESAIDCTVAGAAWDAATNRSRVTLTYSGGEFNGKTRAVFNSNGTGSITTLALNEQGYRVTTTSSGALNSSCDGITTGTRTVVTEDLAANQTVDEASYDIATGALLSHSVATERDSFGRPTRLDYSDGTFSTRSYACCGLEAETDRDGRTTTYEYDAAGRIKTVSRDGITTINTYDPAGRLVKVTRRGGGSDIVQQIATYDLTGRRLSSTDALERQTTYAEWGDEQGARIKSAAYADGGNLLETYARDGSLLKREGSAVFPLKCEYGQDEDGLFTKEIRVGSEGESEWTKTSQDFAGRPYKVLYPDGAVAMTYYNSLGQVVRSVDPDGVQTLYAYNSLGERTVAAIDLNRDGTIDYGGIDRITRTNQTVGLRDSVAVNRTTTEVWTADGNATPATISVVESTPNGRKSWQTVHGLTTHTIISYNGSGGQTAATTFPDGSTMEQSSENGRPTSEYRWDANGATLSQKVFDYDGHARLLTQAVSGQGTTTYTYYDDDRVHTVTTPDPDSTREGLGYDPQTTTYAYDDGGRVNQVTYPDQTQVHTDYYPTGLVERTWGSRTNPTAYNYDSQGRISALFTWQSMDDFAAEANYAITMWDYDAQRGWLTRKRYPGDHGPAYTYTPAGRLNTRTWDRGVTTTYGYNLGGEVADVTYSDSTPAVACSYDRQGRLQTVADAAGTCTRSYHASGQLQDETYAGSGLLTGAGLARTFDSLDRLSGLSGASVPSIIYGYDATSRLQTVTVGTNVATYGYTPDTGLVGTVTVLHDGATRLTTTNTFDQLGRLAVIASQPSGLNASLTYAYTYNAANQRTLATREDSSSWAYTYDEFGQVTSARKKLSTDQTLLGHDFAWTFDAMGNRKSAAVNGRAAVYTPNLLNQYDQREVAGAVDVYGTAAVDATVTVNLLPTTRQDERFYRTVTTDNSTSAQYPAINVVGVKNNVGPNAEDAVMEATRHAFVAQNPEGFAYDEDGNLTLDGHWAYTWDAENRLTSMETIPAAVTAGAAQQKLEFAYDAMGRRVQKKVSIWNAGTSSYDPTDDTRFIYDGWNLASELDARTGNAARRTYAWGLDLSGAMQTTGGAGGLLSVTDAATSATHFAAFDGNGNLIGMVRAEDGTLSARYDYNAFGEIVASEGTFVTGNPFGFSTKFTDVETGLSYYGFRYYNPSTGRWLSRDPIEEQGGVNLYGFVGNDPVDTIDPLGEDFIAVGTRPLAGFLGVIAGGDMSPANHLSIEYYEGCAQEGKIFTQSSIPKGATKKAARELRADSSYSRVITYQAGRAGRVFSKNETVAISVIQNVSDAVELAVIYADQDAKAKWATIINTADSYPYAEHGFGPLKNWPNSKYGYPTRSNANNSNTFIRVLARSIGKNADIVGGFHPGNDFPIPVSDNGPVPQPK